MTGRVLNVHWLKLSRRDIKKIKYACVCAAHKAERISPSVSIFHSADGFSIFVDPSIVAKETPSSSSFLLASPLIPFSRVKSSCFTSSVPASALSHLCSLSFKLEAEAACCHPALKRKVQEAEVLSDTKSSSLEAP